MDKGTKDIILYGGLLLGGAYVLYNVTKPIANTIGGVGSGISSGVQGIGGGIATAFEGTGSGISQVAQGVASPFEFADSSLNNVMVTKKAISTATLPSKVDRAVSIEEQRTDVTKKALKSNYGEQLQRQKEYGSSPKEWFAKMFMPTASVGRARTEAVFGKKLFWFG